MKTLNPGRATTKKRSTTKQHESRKTLNPAFFLFIHARMRPIQIMAAYIFSRLPVRSPREAARCKLPFALRPGLSPERIAAHQRKTKRKRKTKEKTKEQHDRPLLLSSRCQHSIPRGSGTQYSVYCRSWRVAKVDSVWLSLPPPPAPLYARLPAVSAPALVTTPGSDSAFSRWTTSAGD